MSGHGVLRFWRSPMLFFGTVAAMVVSVSAISGEGVDGFVTLTSYCIGLLSVMIIVNRRNGMLAQVVGVFSLILFSVMPIIEYKTHTIYWGGAEFSDNERLFGNLLVALFLLVFMLSYKAGAYLQLSTRTIGFFQGSNYSKQWIVFIASVSLYLFLLPLYDFDVTGLLLRGGELSAVNNASTKGGFLIVEFYLRPLIFNIGLSLLLCARRITLPIVGCVILSLAAAAPTGIPRFLVAALYMPAVLYLLLSLKGTGELKFRPARFLLPNILLYGLFIFLPILELFRFFSPSNAVSFGLFGFDSLLAGHFDAYQMFLRALAVGELSYGFGFLGVVLFAVPRAIWPQKPISSGNAIAEVAGLSFDNVSQPLLGEFYLNFSYIGIFLGAIALGLFLRYADRLFDQNKGNSFGLFDILYFQFVGCLFLILRGGLLSAYAFTVSLLLTWVTIITFRRTIGLR